MDSLVLEADDSGNKSLIERSKAGSALGQGSLWYRRACVSDTTRSKICHPRRIPAMSLVLSHLQK